MGWRSVIGTMELYHLAQVEKLYLDITREQDAELEKLVAKEKDVEDGFDEFGRSNKEQYDEYLADEAYQNEQLQQTLFRSFLLTIAMFIEHDLRGLCGILQKETGERFSVDEISRNPGMSVCIRYVEKLSGKKLLDGDTDLQALMELRNIVAHHNARVSSTKQADLKNRFSKSTLGIDFSNNELYIHKDSLKAYLTLAKKIYDAISDLWVEKDF